MYFFWYQILHIVSFAATSLLAAYAWRRRSSPGAVPFAVAMLLWSTWIAASALEMAARDLPTKLFWADLHYIGFVGGPVAWFIMTCEYTGCGPPLNPRRILLLCAVPAATVVLAFTNEAHGLIRSSVYLDTDQEIWGLVRVFGPGYWAALGYTYAVGLAGNLVLFTFAERAPPRQKMQPLALLAGVLLAAPVNLAFSVGVSPIPNFDLTPVLFGFSGLIMGWGIFRFHLFDVVPLDRRQVMASLSDGVITLDGSGELLEVNPAARRILRLPQGEEGQLEVRQLLEAMPVLGRLSDGSAMEVEGSIYGNGVSTRYEARASPVTGVGGRQTGRAIVVRDITKQSEDHSRRVSQQRAVATMQERRRLAREVNAGVNQVLGYVIAEAQALQEMLVAGEMGAARPRLRRLAVVAREALMDAREFVLGAWTADTGEGNFLAAVDSQVQRFGRISSARVRLTTTAATGVQLEPMAEVQLLRVLQEALSGIRGHSGTRFVEVVVEVRDRVLLLSVEDDGALPPAGIRHGGGSAPPSLSSMRERMREVGGRLGFFITPGGGTRLEIEAPLLLERETGGRSVLLGDEDPEFLEGLRYLAAASGMSVAGASQDGCELIEIAMSKRPDVVLLSMGMPGCDGLEAARKIKEVLPESLVVVLAESGDEATLLEAVESGASGYIFKSDGPAHLMRTLADLAMGRHPLSPGLTATLRELARQAGSLKRIQEDEKRYLTPRQADILERVARGMTYKEIARELFLTEPTVKYHMAHIIQRLGVKSREEAILYAQRTRLISDKMAISGSS
ncbi:MAG: histidine kinase N-terminal 7TM domain-containing protein [Chloroflexota bacterium]